MRHWIHTVLSRMFRRVILHREGAEICMQIPYVSSAADTDVFFRACDLKYIYGKGRVPWIGPTWRITPKNNGGMEEGGEDDD